MNRIQIITIFVTIALLLYISRLIIKGKLREEYSIVWCISTFVLIIFSFWRNGLRVLADLFGVIEPANLIFTACIFVVIIYLLHLSVVSSKLHRQNKAMAQEIAILKESSKNQNK
jgi:hypothetical protein